MIRHIDDLTLEQKYRLAKRWNFFIEAAMWGGVIGGFMATFYVLVWLIL